MLMSVGSALQEIIASREARMEFQPVVHLDSGEIVGFEALLRGAVGGPSSAPGPLFAVAAEHGLVAELDAVCQASALRLFAGQGLPPELVLFLNMEPVSLSSGRPNPVVDAVRRGPPPLSVVLEVTERDITRQPAELLHGLARARAAGIGLALDDVGANPLTLAFMPLVEPDVIKLDQGPVQGRFGLATAQICDAVQAESERSGAEILAEGIETVAHVDAARALGASLGQGWLFGVAEPLPTYVAPPTRPITVLDRRLSVPPTPYAVLHDGPSRRLAPTHLRPLLRHLEYRSIDHREPSVLVSSFPAATDFSPASRERYSRLAASGILTVAVAPDMPAEPARGVVGIAVGEDDPVRYERCLLVLSATFAGAVIARQIDGTATFDVILTHDRSAVAAAARSLIGRAGGRRVAPNPR
jgi:EAL domain-containing protein (putative c-di-GMP-specific phosphodiesterase class I)